MGGEAVVALFFLGLFGSAFGTIYYFLQTRHRERMSLIENGADAKLFQTEPRRHSYFFALMIGIVFICLSLGIGVGYLIDTAIDNGRYYHNDNPMAYFISIFFFIGVGFISSFVLHKKMVQKN